MLGVSGGEYRSTMDKVLPSGWFDQAVKDSDTFFQIDLHAVRLWRLSATDKVKQPILSIYGTEKRFGDRIGAGAEFDKVLHSWFPQTESLPIRGAHHWPHVNNLTEVAKGITTFVDKNANGIEEHIAF
jgi:hypothetical protein